MDFSSYYVQPIDMVHNTCIHVLHFFSSNEDLAPIFFNTISYEQPNKITTCYYQHTRISAVHDRPCGRPAKKDSDTPITLNIGADKKRQQLCRYIIQLNPIIIHTQSYFIISTGTNVCSYQAGMATLDTLKQTLRQTARATASCATQPLSHTQYSAGFDVLMQGSGWMTYQNFIVPQLSSLLDRLLNSRVHISAETQTTQPTQRTTYIE
ncbi:hypothetical protein HZ326_29539 [Fusarium oxysporum f. sp. albedinis]|nr:hypothetical protein HZ326_29539 [Fusarium oxysporum f. sp. albedinis]